VNGPSHSDRHLEAAPFPAPEGEDAARVLIVDDEPSVAEVFHEFLAAQGYALSLAASGEEAVRMLPDLKPDMILTDLNLPGLSGLEVMRAAKTVDPEVCVVVVTGYASASTAIDALRQGAYDYVTKPFDLDDVFQIVERGIANRRLKMLNRRLIEELRQKNEILREHEDELRERVRVATQQMTSLYEVGKVISADLDLERRMAVICNRAAGMCGARAAVLYLRQEQSDVFYPASAFGAPLTTGEGAGQGFVLGDTRLGISAVEQHPARAQAIEGAAAIEVPGIPGGCRSLLVIPLVDESQVIGVMAVIDKPGGFSAAEESFMALFASQSAIALRNSQLYERTRSLDRLKSEFVAVVSHEIRTPLTSVKGAVELLADEHYFTNSEQQMKLLTIAHANAERLLVLINDILDFSRLESSSLPMSLELQRLEPIVTQVAQNLRTQLEERRLQLETTLAAGLPEVMVDGHRIAQVLTNLISNAIKFSPAGGHIEISAEPWNACVRVGVRDHGEGIAPQDLPKLFRKFSQIDSSATRKAGGTGLGLVICKGIIEQHGGQMAVESTPGEGSTFFFILPPATPASVAA
jgi:signal transduction histidine kinase/DNA-binding response OmpR family regulator